MNKEIIVIAFFIVMVVLFILIVRERSKEIGKENIDKVDKLISVLKEYSKKHPDLAETLNKIGLL